MIEHGLNLRMVWLDWKIFYSNVLYISIWVLKKALVLEYRLWNRSCSLLRFSRLWSQWEKYKIRDSVCERVCKSVSVCVWERKSVFWATVVRSSSQMCISLQSESLLLYQALENKNLEKFRTCLVWRNKISKQK